MREQMSEKIQQRPSVPPAYSNLFETSDESNRDKIRIVDIALHSDAHIVGEIPSELGPYQFINKIGTFPSSPMHHSGPVLALRMKYVPPNFEDFLSAEKTEESNYVGMGVGSELSALLSLALGTRLAESGNIALSRKEGEPYKPCAEDPYSIPTIPPRLPGILPRLSQTANIASANDLLSKYFRTQPEAATILSRVAGLYQSAVWMADAAPQMCWLQLVSACEAAAHQWFHGRAMEASEELKQSFASVAKLLGKYDEKYGTTLLDDVASKMSNILGATHKFKSFMKAFLPPPPDDRPLVSLQTSWENENLISAISAIYQLRSKTLHSGQPFPLPLCILPPIGYKNGVPEKPIGVSSASMGGSWIHEKLPLNLHTFEYIVRSAIQKW
jgi:hypothetical protein